MNKRKLVVYHAISVLFLSMAPLSRTEAQPSAPAVASLQTVSSADNSDDTDLDFETHPIPVKYAHGFKKHSGGPSPAPANPEARKHYFQAQELQEKGQVYLYDHQFGKAITRLKSSLSLWPDSATTYRWLAETYEASGQTKEAITNYRLLFYGWPGKSVPTDDAKAKPKETPNDKPSDYDQPNPEETDPTLLMRFALLLQQTSQYAEAQTIYERGMIALSEKSAAKGEPLPPLFASSFTSPTSLEAATRTALAIDQSSYQDKKEAEENLKQALLLQPDFITALYYKAKLVNNQQ